MLERIFSLHDPDVFVAHRIWQHPKDLNPKAKESTEEIVKEVIAENEIADVDHNLKLGSSKNMQDLSEISKMT